jgi:hypothetical protein
LGNLTTLPPPPADGLAPTVAIAGLVKYAG